MTAASRRSSGVAVPRGSSGASTPASFARTAVPDRLHPTAGGVLVGVRSPLVAFNVNLRRDDVEAAREIASLVRERDGGFPGVRALGLDLPSAGLVQVSMNVTDWQAARLHEIVGRIVPRQRCAGSRSPARSSSGSCLPGLRSRLPVSCSGSRASTRPGCSSSACSS